MEGPLWYLALLQDMYFSELTVDFDGTLWASGTHFVGSFDCKFTGWATRGTADDKSIKSIRIFCDFEAGTFGNIRVTFEPSNGRGWLAINLSFQHNLLGKKQGKKRLNSVLLRFF